MSKRFASTSGVIQCASGRSRSARSTSDRRASSCDSDCSRASSAARSASHSSVLTSASTSSGVGPASRTPDSSKVSRTAAHTSARASALVAAERAAHCRRRRPGPADLGGRRRPGRPSRRGTRASRRRRPCRLHPPQQVDLGPVGASRSSATVAASRGRRGRRSPRRAGAARARPGPTATRRSVHERDLDDAARPRPARRAAGRRRPTAERACCAGVAEDLAEQLGGAVDDPRLAGEVRRRGDEADDLDDPHDALEADQRVDRGQRVERAGAGQLLGLLGRDERADLADGGQRALDHRQLPGGEDQVAGAHGRDVRRDRRHDRRQLQAELGQPARAALTRLGRLR